MNAFIACALKQEKGCHDVATSTSADDVNVIHEINA